MREDELFNDLYQRPMYGGSFYKKTKFGNPEEFDLDLILKLPVNYDYIQVKHCCYLYVFFFLFYQFSENGVNKIIALLKLSAD